MDLLRESQASLIVSPLEQLFQGVSPQTRKADHIINIARYVHHISFVTVFFKLFLILCLKILI